MPAIKTSPKRIKMAVAKKTTTKLKSVSRSGRLVNKKSTHTTYIISGILAILAIISFGQKRYIASMVLLSLACLNIAIPGPGLEFASGCIALLTCVAQLLYHMSFSFLFLVGNKKLTT